MLALDFPTSNLQRLVLLCLTVTTESVSLQDEESGRTLEVLLMSLGRKHGLMWRQKQQRTSSPGKNSHHKKSTTSSGQPVGSLLSVKYAYMIRKTIRSSPQDMNMATRLRWVLVMTTWHPGMLGTYYFEVIDLDYSFINRQKTDDNKGAVRSTLYVCMIRTTCLLIHQYCCGCYTIPVPDMQVECQRYKIQYSNAANMLYNSFSFHCCVVHQLVYRCQAV